MNTSDHGQPIFEKDDAPDVMSPEIQTSVPPQISEKLRSRRDFLRLAAVFTAGLGGGYFLRELTVIVPTNAATATATGEQATGTTVETVEETTGTKSENMAVIDQLNLPDHYSLPVSYEDIGPQLLASGAIDYDRFVQVYDEAGQPLTQAQQEILTQGSAAPIVITRENAYFLLNFFWALGLVNQNVILTEGPMMQYGGPEQIENFASTGGWTLAAKPMTDLYASTPIITLTPEQQARLEEVASAVYRPCCNNPTAFPDCNHGMAMLGLLELMASQNATVEEMFTATKYVNAFWFPQQTVEVALLFKNVKGQDFIEADAREFVGPGVFSASGFQAVHQWLAKNNLLEQVPNGGNGCGV
jgi:hypothetical protein